MSTEHQRYSLENQAMAITEYAERRGYTIVQTYEDAGKSGLSIRGRDGLKQLLADVVTGQTTFSAILVLDVSRWGRFPDTDQSAHYEFLCRDAGVAVEYCGEQFENDGSMVSAIQEYETGDGKRVQPRAIRKGLQSAPAAGSSRIQPGRTCALRRQATVAG
ncbi:recombinase family protein, partial [Mesorhizobium sp. M0208]|uniref:recombinase family protein n=1 Tax=Mesorhizobium sp. M0208 TaxID=2956916 RepID=UPI00333D33DE